MIAVCGQLDRALNALFVRAEGSPTELRAQVLHVSKFVPQYY